MTIVIRALVCSLVLGACLLGCGKNDQTTASTQDTVSPPPKTAPPTAEEQRKRLEHANLPDNVKKAMMPGAAGTGK